MVVCSRSNWISIVTIVILVFDPINEPVIREEQVVEWENSSNSADKVLKPEEISLLWLVESIEHGIVAVFIEGMEGSISSVSHGVFFVVVHGHQEFGIFTSVKVPIIVQVKCIENFLDGCFALSICAFWNIHNGLVEARVLA